MAFTSKGARDFNFIQPTATLGKIGPGSYDASYSLTKGATAFNETKANQQKPPFMSTTKRGYINGKSVIHDPEAEDVIASRNNFEYESEVIKKYLRKPQPNSNFDSRSLRLPKKKFAKAPDPGDYYKDPVELEIKKIQVKEQNNALLNKKNDIVKIAKEKYYREQHKPSVPGRNEKFGYTFVKTEDYKLNGEAFRNFNPDVLAGDAKNSVGPGEYNPKKISLEKHVKGPVIRFANKDDRFNASKNTTTKNIGPGSYNILDSVPAYKFKPSSTFLSTGPKCLLDYEKKILKSDQVIPKNLGNPMDDDYDTQPTTLPGPGSYYNSKRDTSFNSGNKSHKFQLFNSSVARFPEKKWNSFIGPGTYENQNNYAQAPKLTKSSLQPNSHRLLGKNMVIQKPNIPFNSETQREYEVERANDIENQIPGPGTYDNPYDMAKVIEKKVEKSKKRRKRAKSEMPLATNKENLDKSDMMDDDKKSDDEGKLGPGSYYHAHANPKKKRAPMNATFVSNVDRFAMRQQNNLTMDDLSHPPVGIYEQNYYDINKGPKKANNVAFNTGGKRWVPPNQTISEGDMEGYGDIINDTKYKFTAAFGGGFRGGLSIDSKVKTGKQAPFGSHISRFNKKGAQKDGVDNYICHSSFEKRSYNILYV